MDQNPLFNNDLPSKFSVFQVGNNISIKKEKML